MGDYIYAFSSAGATVHRTGDLQLMVEIEIPGIDSHKSTVDAVEVKEVEGDDSGGSSSSSDPETG